MNLGNWQIDDLITFPCNTHTAATGAATDADSVPSYRVYEDETGTAILTGSMAKLDDAGTTGFYSEQLTLSAANGFEVGKSYTIYISATVATIVGTMSHTFQVEAAPATAAAVAALPTVTTIWAGITAAAARTIADHVLRRSWASAAASSDGDTLSFRSLLGAVAKLVNKVAVSGSTLTVYKEDDSTSLGTQTLTTDASASPITGADTVG